MLPTLNDLKVKAAKKILLSLDNFDRQNKEIKSELLKELDYVMSFRDFFELKNYQRNFEKIFAKFCGKRYAVGMSSGTASIQLSLLANGICKNDEVITTTNTNIATAVAIANTGAKPVLVDINPESYLIDETKIEEFITDATKAIIPVHLYGDVCEMDEIGKIAKKHNLRILEDCAQAHGITYKKRKVPIGTTGCFSFSTNKLLGGFGSGGITVTDEKQVVKKLRMLTDAESNYDNPFMLESKRTIAELDVIQIVFIKAKLPFYEKYTERRRHLANLYTEILKDTDIILPRKNKNVKHGFYRYIIRTKNRDKLKRFLFMHRILTQVNYPYLIHIAKAFSYLGYKIGDFPVAETCQKEFLSLPLNPWFKNEEIIRIANIVRNFVSKK